jgi:hypothetical protein
MSSRLEGRAVVPRIKLLIAGGIFAVLAAGLASAQEEAPLSPADFKKLISLVDTTGTKETFPPPIAANLGLSQDKNKDLPIVNIVTTDNRIYFCRSGWDAKDYIIWVIGEDEKSSKMFVTHADLKLTRALYMRAYAVPQLQNTNDPAVEADYKKALAALAKDIQQRKTK